MHLRGRSIEVAGDSGVLLHVPRWDFHHQEGYWLERSVSVKRASLTCQWDNRPGRAARRERGSDARAMSSTGAKGGTDDE